MFLCQAHTWVWNVKSAEMIKKKWNENEKISLYKHIGEDLAIYGIAKQSIYWTLLYDYKE